MTPHASQPKDAGSQMQSQYPGQRMATALERDTFVYMPPFVPHIKIHEITKEILSESHHDITPTSNSFTQMLKDPRDRISEDNSPQRQTRLEKAHELYLKSLDGAEVIQSTNLREMASLWDDSEILSLAETTKLTESSEQSINLSALTDPEIDGSTEQLMVLDMQAFVLNILNRTCTPVIQDGDVRDIKGPKLHHKTSEVFSKIGRRLRRGRG